MGGVIFRYTLNISVTKICKFLTFIEIDLFYSNISSRNSVLLQTPLMQAINLIIYNTAMENRN